MAAPKRLHEIFIREHTPMWLRDNAGAMFSPETFIPSFEEFSNGERDLEWSEYEDLVFLPVLGHFLSQVPLFNGPRLVVLTQQLSQRARLFPDLLNLLNEQNMVLPCEHLVGVSLDMEDVLDINAYTTEAAGRAERVAAIFRQDFSTPEKTDVIAAKLTDEEAVDIFLYSILESEKAFNLPRPVWAIQQAQQAMDEVDALWNNGLPEGVEPNRASEEYVPRDPTGKEPTNFMLVVLTEKTTGKNAELLRTNLDDATVTMRVAGQWGDYVPSEYWKLNYDFHPITATPELQAHIIELFDTQQHNSTDLSEYFFVPGQPRKIAQLSDQDLENYLNAEVVFTDSNGIECKTAQVGVGKQVWPAFDQALGTQVGEVWVFRPDVLLPQASNQASDDLTLQFFVGDMADLGLTTIEVQVQTTNNQTVPALMVPVPRNKMSKNLASDIAVSAMMTGRLGIYHFAGSEMTVYTSSAIGYNGKRPFQIVLA